jgi:two-component system aerobic respiration control sensor histidine kinase ArcB
MKMKRVNLLRYFINLILRKHTLKKLLKKQAFEITRLKDVIDNLPGSIYWKDKNGVYLGNNVFAKQKMLSVNLNPSVIGKTDYDLFEKTVADRFTKHDQEVINNNRAMSHEETTILPDGQRVVQLSLKRPLHDKRGRVIGIVGNTVDITELKNTQEKLSIAKKKAEDSNRAKMNFIQNMEHDIRTPFAGIYSITSILVSMETDPEKMKFLSAIEKSSKELLDYCNGIIELVRIESGKLEEPNGPVNLRNIIQSVINMEIAPALHKKIDLLAEYSDDLPEKIVSNSLNLQRILVNLVSNAVKFTDKGYVKILVTVEKYLDQINKVIIRVEDTGKGIPADKYDYIFERFTRLTPSNGGTYKGTGLGLSVVKYLVEELQGTIELTSMVGQGSVFTCTFPLQNV